MALLDGFLDGLRSYAAARDGRAPVAARFGGMAPPSAPPSGIDAPMLDGGGDGAAYMGGGYGYVPPADPFASDDAARADAASRIMPNQSAIPFAGMLAGANGGLGGQSGAFDPSAFTPAMVRAQGLDGVPTSGMTPNAAGPVPFAARSVALANSAMPQSGDPATTTISAHRPPAPAVAAAPAAPAGPATPNNPPGASFLARLSNTIAMHPNMLLALGAGLSGAPTFGQGMSRAFAAAIPAGRQDIAQNMQMQGLQESYKALVGQGVPPQEALAALYNPEVMKNIVPRYFGGAHWGIVGYDPDTGMARYGMINEGLQTVTPADQLAVPTVKTPEDVIRLPRGQRFIWNGHAYIR